MKRKLIALLNLSSWCLVMVERLFLAVPRGCLQFVIVVFPDHTHLLFLMLERIFPVGKITGYCLNRRRSVLVRIFFTHTFGGLPCGFAHGYFIERLDGSEGMKCTWPSLFFFFLTFLSHLAFCFHL